MRSSLIFSIFLFLFTLNSSAQNFHFVLEKDSIAGFSGLQSFAWGKSGDEWILVGGRTDGLHRRQPPFSFLASENNDYIYVINPTTHQMWSKSVSAFDAGIADQLQSTNMNFVQDGDYLYLTGGYGYSIEASNHITYDRLIKIDVPKMIDSIKQSGDLSDCILSIEDSLFQVAGGQMGILDNRLVLACGNKFTGRYNPMNGPSFTQEYTDQLRRFKIEEVNGDLVLDSVDVESSSTLLHRRDYNMIPQILPGGSFGYIIYSGVFQYITDLPFHDIVLVDGQGYQQQAAFEQLLNQYHTARLSIYDSNLSESWAIFFGGIGHYVPDGNGNFIKDDDVPFVKSLSAIRRSGSTYQELHLDDLSDYIGASAEFIPSSQFIEYDREILDLQSITDTSLVGYIVGGIESSLDNIFWTNTGTQSWTNPYLYKVKLVPTPLGITENVPDISGLLELKVYPNPTSGKIKLSCRSISSDGQIIIHDSSERAIISQRFDLRPNVEKELELDLSHLAKGSYLVTFISSIHSTTQTIIIK